MYNLFLTGPRGIGKTTLLKKIIERLDCSIGGFMTKPVVTPQGRSFDMTSLFDGSSGNLILTFDNSSLIRKGITKTFETSGVDIIIKSLGERDVIVMDELGFLESEAKHFQNAVIKALNSSKAVIGILKQMDVEFLNAIKNRSDTVVLDVTMENRDNMEGELLDILENWNVPFKTPGSFVWSDKQINWYNEALDHPMNNYQEIFISEIKKYIDNFRGFSILDIGCGTGAFSIPLAKLGAHITALDSSLTMLSSLKYKAQNEDISIQYILSPWGRTVYMVHDAALCAFCSGAVAKSSELKKLYDCINSFIFIIGPVDRYRNNFNISSLLHKLDMPLKLHRHTCSDIIKAAEELGFEYDYKEVTYSLGQYFECMDDALNFLAAHFYIRPEEDIYTAQDFLDRSLIKYDKGYFLPNSKKAGIVVIKK